MYYTCWVLVLVRAYDTEYLSHIIIVIFPQPFIESSHITRNWFPDPFYAIAIPATVLVSAIVGGGLFISTVLLNEASKAKKSS